MSKFYININHHMWRMRRWGTNLSIEASPDDARRMTSRCASIALGSHDHGLEIDELTKMGLLVTLSNITASRRDQEHVGHIRLLSRVDEFNCDVVLLLVSRRDQAHGIATRLLESLDHVALATRLVWNNYSPYDLTRQYNFH